MFGKVLINEFIQRSRKTIGVCAVLIGSAVICAVMRACADGSSGVMETLFGLSVFVFSSVILGSMFGFIVFQFTDFTKRCYKDEGYLTHTLPISSSELILGRMIADIVAMVLIQAFLILSVLIATGDFDIISRFLEEVSRDIQMLKRYDLDDEYKTMLFTFVMVIFTGELYVVWHLNVSYAVGHAFRSARRILSVVFCVVFYFVMMFGGALISEMFKDESSTRFYDVITARRAIRAVNHNLWIAEIFMLVMLAIYGVIVARCFKKHLNLE